jgi:undecaprenyl-diphosphatase
VVVKVLIVVAAWAVLAGLLIGVGEGVVHSSWVNSFDRHATSVAIEHRSPGLDAVMKAVTWLGSWVAVVVAAVIVTLTVLARRLPVTVLVLAVGAWAGSQGAVTLAKHVVRRPRPPQPLWLVNAHGSSWPSGHAATAVLVFAILAAIVIALVPIGWIRTSAACSAVAAVVAVACSRVVLGVHWTTDVIAGIVFVVGWLLSLAVVTTGRSRGGWSPKQ